MQSHPEALQKKQKKIEINPTVSRDKHDNRSVIALCLFVVIFLHNRSLKSMQWVLLATAWTTFSKFLPNFCAEGFFRRILGKKHRIPPLFKKKKIKIKYSFLLEKHSSHKLLNDAWCISNNLTTLPLYSLGNFPEKGSLQEPSWTLSLSMRHFRSLFQASTYIFKHLNLQKQNKQKQQPKTTTLLSERQAWCHNQEYFFSCLTLTIKTPDALK